MIMSEAKPYLSRRHYKKTEETMSSVEERETKTHIDDCFFLNSPFHDPRDDLPLVEWSSHIRADYPVQITGRI